MGDISVGQLKKLLEGAPDNWVVIMASDEEGNSYGYVDVEMDVTEKRVVLYPIGSFDQDDMDEV